MSKAIYALSADPITYGHINIIQRAKRVFDEVIVAIGINPAKKYTFSLAERKEMAEKCFADEGIKVMSFSNLLVDFAYEQGVDTIVKGIRNAADFDYENLLDTIGNSQQVGIDTHVLFADSQYSHVSSSAVKEIVKYNGVLAGYVPLHVKQALEERINGQYIMGVTGEIGCGKSFIGEVMRHEATNIELDHIGHEILCDLEEPAYVQVRRTIANVMGEKILDEYGFIKRGVLGSIVFNDYQKLIQLNKIMEKPIMVRLRQELKGKKGVILINCALLAEAQMLHVCNNNVLLVKVDKDTQKKRLLERGLTEEQIKTRLECQYTEDNKKRAIEIAINGHKHGKLYRIGNSEGMNDKDMIYERLSVMFADLKKEPV